MEANFTIQHILNSLLEFISYWTQDLLHSPALYQCRDHVRSDNHRYVNQATTVCVKIVLPSIYGEVYFFVLDFGVKIAFLH